MLTGLSGFSAARYDVHGKGALRHAYIIAASYRCGSTHLCTRLWRTGRLGAPFEYWNYEHEMKFLSSRLEANSPADYLEKLIHCRMTDNGVFGIKAHFHHFHAALRGHAGLLQRLKPLDFIFIRRQHKIAQAVSLAKALQTRAWFALNDSGRSSLPLFYSKDFITACLQEVHSQEKGWMEWFSSHNVTPLVVHYEDLLSDEQTVVHTICKQLEVDLDSSLSIAEVPIVTRQSDEINDEWIRRYEADQRQ